MRANGKRKTMASDLNGKFGSDSKRRALYEKLLQQEKLGRALPSTIPRRRSAGAAPLSFAQERLWFLHQLEPDNPAYNIPIGLRWQGPLNLSVLQRCLDEILQRHEALRTRFETVEDRPHQVVEPMCSLGMPLTDLSGLPEERREAEALQLCTQEARRPFDLAHSPVLRAKLLRLGPQEHIFLLVMHHIASDGWSIGVLIRELKTLYQAFCESKPSPLPELPVQYADYAVWQRDRLRGEVLEQQLSYWKKQLEGAPVLLELPADHARPATQSYHGALLSYELPKPLRTALTELSRRGGASLFMTLLAAFETLLYRYTGLEDVVVGSAIAGRNQAELESLIGFFVNTLVLRGDLSGNPSFRTLLSWTREVALGAYAHQDLPFEKVVELLQPERDLSHSPLFQIMLVLQNAPAETVQLAGLEVTPLLIDNSTSKFDLTLFVWERGECLKGVVEYNKDLFDVQTIRRMLSHFQNLLEGIVSNPDQRLSDLPLLTSAERHQLLVEWNDTTTEYPRDQCIHELFEMQARKTPEAVAVVFEDQQLTYRELNARANQLAHYLQAHGVRRGALVAIYVERSLEMVIGLLGILKAGGTYVPLDPAYPKLRLAFMLEDTRTQVLLTQERLRSSLPENQARVVCLDSERGAILEESAESLDGGATPDSLAYVIYTSGSTGKPKGTCIPHRAVVRLVRNTNYVSLTARDVFLQFAPISFDASTFEIWGCLLNGGRLVVAPPFTPSLEELGQWIQKHEVTTLWLTAALFQQMAEYNLQSLNRVRQLLAGGETLPAAQVRKVVANLKGCQLINGYGPTENTTFTCCYPVKDSSPLGRSVPIGRPIANTQVYVLDRHRQPVPVGVPGELYIGGDGLAQGYLNQPELTAKQFVSNPFNGKPGARLYRSGDLARWLPDGNLEFLGRIDHQVKIRGFRIELGEIESVLAGHPGVREAVVVLREDVPGDKRLVAYLTPKAEARPGASELRGLLQAKLPEYMVPSAFVILERLPRSPNGKVDPKALPKPEFGSAAPEFVPPRTPTETALAKIWCEVLGLKQVGVHDNFFDLGGHSLLAMRLVSQIKRDLKFGLPVRTLFRHPTIEELAKALSAQQTKGRKPELIQLQAGNAGPELFFLIDEGSLGLFKLAHFMGEGPTLYASVVPLPESALRAAAKKQFAALPRMEDLAAEHAALIRSHQMTGPLLLAGHCFGGMLAFEVAHQLQRAGQPVEAVLMLDTWMIRPTSWWRKKTWFRAHGRKLLQQGPLYLWQKSRRRINLERDRLAATLKLAISHDFSAHVPWAIIEKVYRHVMAGYRPQVLASRGMLFVSRDDWLSSAYRGLDGSLGASRWFGGGVEILDVPGDHVTVLDEPHLLELARRYRDGLEKLESRRFSSQSRPLLAQVRGPS